MDYSPEQIAHLNSDYSLLLSRYRGILLKLSRFSAFLKKTESQEYVFHGVCRRYGVMFQCVENIFSTYPLNRDIHNLLTEKELDSLTINLQAFCINTSGVLDNLAWIYVLENGFKCHERQVAFFSFVNPKKDSDIRFPKPFCEHINAKITTWHDEYLKRYRDTLAHRIPLYVPPYATRNGKEAIREIVNCFAESRLKDSQIIPFHAQTIADFITIEEVVVKYLEFVWKGYNGWNYSHGGG